MSPTLPALVLALAATAHATTGFDPTTPEGVCTGDQAATHDGTIPLWSAIEHHVDPGSGLFTQEEFNDLTEWPTNAVWAPWIGHCFGSNRPHSSEFLLHLGPREATTFGTPILFVPGAGDNGSRGFITMATRMNNVGRPVYTLTFAHPHGDVFQQAEIVADAIARIKERTGAAQVDVVAHSKGGIPASVYAANHGSASWGRSDFETAGTRYRGDVRRLVLIASPLGGVDTSYRWPSGNYLSLDADEAMAPTSWSAYYPSGTATWWVETDLSAQDLMPDGGDLFPGQRQLLRRWDHAHDLPGSDPTLGAYALQQDWYTTYEGGYGYFSYSAGIDAAIAAADDVLGALEDNGVDPGVEIFLLAGDNPLMHNGAEYLVADGLEMAGPLGLAAPFAAAFSLMVGEGADTWAQLIAQLVDDGLVDQGISQDEVQGIVQGKLILGEVSGPSDGIIFVESALRDRTLTGRGAIVVEEKTVDLAHLDLLYASEITGQILIDAGDANPEDNAWQRAFGERYKTANTLDWVEAVLADEASGDDGGGVGGDDGGTGSDDGSGAGGGTGGDDGGDTTDGGDDGGDDGGVPYPGKTDARQGSCSTTTAPVGLVGMIFALGLLGARRDD